MLDPLIDLLFPPMTLKREAGAWLTDDERQALRTHAVLLEGLTLRKAGMPCLDRLAAAAEYGSSPLLREAIRRFKYRRVSAYADELGRMIAEASEFLPSYPPPVLCPVPLHWTRRYVRGFNQAEVLAEAISRACGWPVRSVLRRTRATGSQARRSRGQRRCALRDAFRWQGSGDVPTRIILVDDVATTGATLDACACALKDAGVQRVDAVTIAVALA